MVLGMEILSTKSYPVPQCQWTIIDLTESDLWRFSVVCLGLSLLILHMNDFLGFIQGPIITMYADDKSLHKAFRTSRELKREMSPASPKFEK